MAWPSPMTSSPATRPSRFLLNTTRTTRTASATASPVGHQGTLLYIEDNAVNALILDSTGRRLSFVFQEATLMPWARVMGNVRLPLDLAGVPRPQAHERVMQALQLVGLGGYALFIISVNIIARH